MAGVSRDEARMTNPGVCAPAGGYEFGNKRQYRRRIWKTFRSFAAQLDGGIKGAHALLMPSKEGAEIDVALDYGFSEHNLHVVDRNPAIVATNRRRYPRVNTYGVDIVRACARIERNGLRLSVANFDLTTHVFGAMPWLLAIGKMSVFCPEFVIAVTLLKGREPGNRQPGYSLAYARTAGPVMAFNQKAYACAEVEDEYRSGTQVMRYQVIRGVEVSEFAKRYEDAAYAYERARELLSRPGTDVGSLCRRFPVLGVALERFPRLHSLAENRMLLMRCLASIGARVGIAGAN